MRSDEIFGNPLGDNQAIRCNGFYWGHAVIEPGFVERLETGFAFRGCCWNESFMALQKGGILIRNNRSQYSSNSGIEPLGHEEEKIPSFWKGVFSGHTDKRKRGCFALS